LSIVAVWYNPFSNEGEISRMVRLRIREVAEQKGMSMSKLSRIADVNYKTIQHVWRDPYQGINTKTLERIAKALEVSTGELIEDVPDSQEPHPHV
jgi:DNA-binding Xre family transcriptional regulator